MLASAKALHTIDIKQGDWGGSCVEHEGWQLQLVCVPVGGGYGFALVAETVRCTLKGNGKFQLARLQGGKLDDIAVVVAFVTAPSAQLPTSC
ncbi:TPA: hypothetical protein ACH3X3_011594 [Trebouxia sp. C0006]